MRIISDVRRIKVNEGDSIHTKYILFGWVLSD